MSLLPPPAHAPRLLLSRLYYGVDTGRQDADTQGDALLRDLHSPLVADLRDAMPECIIGWMRFCARGYHIQLQVIDQESLLVSIARPLVTARLQAFVRANPGHFSQPMHLPELAQKVSSEFAPNQHLALPGEQDCNVFDVPAPAAPYASIEQFIAAQRLLQAEAVHAFRILECCSTYGARLAFWRCHTVQLLQLLAFELRECTALLAAWVSGWKTYFRLDEAMLRNRAARMPGNAGLAAAICAAGVAPTWNPLPEALARELASLRESQRTLADALRSSCSGGGDITAQVRMLLHTSANRLGISIMDETAHGMALLAALQTAAPTLNLRRGVAA